MWALMENMPLQIYRPRTSTSKSVQLVSNYFNIVSLVTFQMNKDKFYRLAPYAKKKKTDLDSRSLEFFLNNHSYWQQSFCCMISWFKLSGQVPHPFSSLAFSPLTQATQTLCLPQRHFSEYSRFSICIHLLIDDFYLLA